MRFGVPSSRADHFCLPSKARELPPVAIESSPRNIAPSTAERSNAWSGIATHCWPSCRALGLLAHHQSHRENVRHCAAQDRAHEGLVFANLYQTDGVQLVIAASKTWRRLKSTNQLPKIIAGVRFNDGIVLSLTKKDLAVDRANPGRYEFGDCARRLLSRHPAWLYRTTGGRRRLGPRGRR